MEKRCLAGLLNFWVFLALGLGVIFGRGFSFYFLSFFLCLFSSGAVYFFYKKNKFLVSDVFILVSFFFIGACLISSFNLSRVEEFLDKRNDICLQVISLPKESSLANSFTARVQKVNSLPLKIKVRVRDYSKSMEYLKSYQFRGKLIKKDYQQRSFYPVRGPLRGIRPRRIASNGVYYLWAKAKEPIVELPRGIGSSFTRNTALYIFNVFKKNCSVQGYKFLSSVFLGRRELLGEEKKYFSDTGTSHFLAISGLHLGLTSLILFFILRFFGLKFEVRLIISLIFLWFYTLLTGISPSTLRAAIMYSVFVLGFFAKRKAHLLNSLGLAGIIALMIDPSVLFSVGFQLSFTACFAIILGLKIFNIRPAKNMVLNYLKQILSCSIFIGVFSTPLVSYYFGKVYILSPLYNIILIPLFTFILIINFILIIFSPFTFAALGIGEILSAVISYFIALTRSLSHINFSFITYTFEAWAVFVYYFALSIIIFLSRRYFRTAIQIVE
ncbi:MAG: ComEC/Rec2 family competence protein [Candidatus Omnitrophota bacterium]